MRFICLCPTYGKTPEVIANSIQCFLDQTHEDKLLVIFDDLGNYGRARELTETYNQILVVSTSIRCPGIVPKYNTMLKFVEGIEYDAIALWDDDDLYLPKHLESHASVLKFPVDWSYPNLVYSTYGNQLRAEESGGRFWASMAILRSSFERIGGFVDSHLATFDQQSLGKFNALLTRGFPDEVYGPTYVFRWQDTKTIHAQHFMGDQVNWYHNVKPGYSKIVSYEDVKPRYQDGVRDIISKLVATNEKVSSPVS